MGRLGCQSGMSGAVDLAASTNISGGPTRPPEPIRLDGLTWSPEPIGLD